MKLNRNDKIDFNYVLITALAVLLSWISHELAHWLMGESLGYNIGMSFNKIFLCGWQLQKPTRLPNG